VSFRLWLAAAALGLVAVVALLRYYAAGMHPIYFESSPQTLAALARYLAGDYAGAAERLRAYLALHPAADAQSDPSYAAQVLLERDRKEEALQLVQTLLAHGPNKPINTLALAAIIETRLGDYERATASWQRALRFGERGTRLSVYAAALDSAQLVLRQPPRPGRDALLAQIFSYLQYYDRGAAASARRHARSAAVKGESAADGWITLGLMHSRSYEADAALEAFERAAAADPGNAHAQYHLASAYSARGDLARELSSALASYSLDPDPQTAKWLLRLLSEKFGDYRRTVAIAEERLARGLQEHGVLFELGRAYGALGDYAAAIGAFTQALAVQPGDANAMAQLAFWNVRAGRRTEAIEVAKRAAAARPDWSYPLRLVARAMAEDFRYQEAIPVYEAAFRVERPETDDLAHLCTLYHGASRWRQGLECFETVLRRDPANPRARRMLAESRNNAALAAQRESAGRR
jgi:tetratricopeptide (TPR) repeat protein